MVCRFWPHRIAKYIYIKKRHVTNPFILLRLRTDARKEKEKIGPREKHFGDKITRTAEETIQRERRICLCLCSKSIIYQCATQRTPGPEILIHRRSCSPDSLARPQTILVCDDALIWQGEKNRATLGLFDTNKTELKLSMWVTADVKVTYLPVKW